MPITEMQHGSAHNGHEDRTKNGHQLKRADHHHVKHLATVQDAPYTYEVLQEIAQYLLDRTNIRPKIGIICGSGLSPIAESLDNKNYFPYEEIPHFPVSTIKGHSGQMVFGHLHGVPIMCMQGRFHYYEGYPLWKCSMPVRVMKLVGVTHLLVTNAAGGLNPSFKTGDIMLMKDHLNLMGLAGNNPLRGPNDDRFGPRFLPLTDAYDKKLLSIWEDVAKELNMQDIVRKGVYACIGGPNYETIAEMKLLQVLGTDAIGMSTVHEVITARHCGMKVMAFSLITNVCIPEYEIEDGACHEEVVQVGKTREPILKEYVSRAILRVKDLLDVDSP